jgi:hypothetical protein
MHDICMTLALHVLHALHMPYMCITCALHLHLICITRALHLHYICITYIPGTCAPFAVGSISAIFQGAAAAVPKTLR